MTAARELLRLLEELERGGTSVIDLVRGGQPIEPWRLYPDDRGIFDRRTRCQVYFEDRSLEILSRVEINVRAVAGDLTLTIPRF